MAKHFLKRFVRSIDVSLQLSKKEESYRTFTHNILIRHESHCAEGKKFDTGVVKEDKSIAQTGKPKLDEKAMRDSSSSVDDNPSDHKWKLEIEWLSKALRPAVEFCRRALPTGNGTENRPPTSSKSFSEIVAYIQQSNFGLQDWSLSDLTIGLYLIYLQQAAKNPFEDVKGVQISSDPIVHDLIYHLELARGAYRDNAAGLARKSMLRESNILKFIKDSSIMRPGYYIGIDPRKQLVILGIRGTHTVYDLVTDIISSSSEEVTFEGYSSHFGTAEAARWFLHHEMKTIKKCLDKYKGFKLRLVGHSLGAATASLLAIMLKRMSAEELGFSPDIISVVGYATPPCVSRELAECCCDYVTTVVMQDDIIPRLSAVSLAKLRNEILQTDWLSVLEKEDWGSVKDFVTNAKHVVSSVQDATRKLADYTNFRSEASVLSRDSTKSKTREVEVSSSSCSVVKENEEPSGHALPELFVPGTVYYLRRNMEGGGSTRRMKGKAYFSLWKRDRGEHFERIHLSNNIISDHKCEAHLYALRDVIKGLPGTLQDSIFK
ncbi:diacylglycerol lipase-beta-like [Impatiens glandulifera]|uniref:diacylglycerol lipase-beta-like n=1 Tax=Impatiens glandulifera TaxID=253017 RepID=UPI001FB1600A|nr:diacylglycerol lipase-beta-like [Impatiens glandulifera]